MKTIRILIAASDEMRDESLKFSELIANLNEVLEPRGIELERVKWNPETDGSIDEFKASLTDCEMCLALYWKNLSSNSGEELDTAYQELKDGHNPRKLYVFFKEPSEDIADALRDFKASFENKYGHFFCRFENADTMNLHFILQFEAYSSQMNSDLVKVTDGKVLVGDKEMVNLDNVPFAAMNKEYQRLQKELLALEEEIAGISVRYAANTKDKELLKQMSSLGSKREQLSEEFEKYQRHLYDIALTFAKQSGEHYSERMRKARVLFEVGKVIEADQILNMEDMKRETKAELTLYELNCNNLESKIDEFRLKAETVMANTLLSIPDRFVVACNAYEEAKSIAEKIHLDKETLVNILFDYAYLKADYNRMHEAVQLYQDALRIYRQLAESNPDAYMSGVAMTLNNLANQQSDLGRYVEAEANYLEALRISRQLAESSSDAYMPYVAKTQNNLAILQKDLGNYVDAEASYLEALRIYRQLAESNPDAYMSDVAMTLNNLAILQKDLGRNVDAEANYQESLRIRRQLAESNPDAYMPDVAMTLNNLANLQSNLDRYDDAEVYYLESLRIYRQLAESNPDAYMPYVAGTLNNLAVLQEKLNRYDDAEANYLKVLRIYRQLAESNPDAYIPGVAKTLYNLGLLQTDLGRWAAAKANYLEALKIFHGLSISTSETYRRWEALTLTKLGNVQEDLENIDEAKRYWREALTIFRELDEKNPGEYDDIIMFLEAWTKEEYK